MKKVTILYLQCVMLIVSFVLCINPVEAATLDASFGQNGKVLTDFDQGPAFIYPKTILEQSDGKIVVVGETGYSRSYAAAMRFHRDGTLDTSFGVSGKVVLPTMRTVLASVAALDHQDRIVLAGQGINASGTTETAPLLVARLTRNGTLDASFSGDGQSSERPSPHPFPYAIAVDAQNRILITGQSGRQTHDGLLVRFGDDGTLDNTLDEDGVLFFNFTSNTTYGSVGFAVTIDAQERILLVASNSVGMVVARLNNDGSLDNSFAGRGFLTDTSLEAAGVSIAVLDSGRIAVAGSHPFYRFAQTRYLETGVRDTSFSGDGFTPHDLGHETSDIYSLAKSISPDGSVTVALIARVPNASTYDSNINLVRFTPAGALDPLFGNAGKAQVSLGEGDEYLQSLGVLRDKSLIFSGAGSNYPYPGGVLVGLQANGALDPQWNGDGFAPSGVVSQDSVENLAVDSQRRIIAIGRTERGPAIARYLENGYLDPSFGQGGKIAEAGPFSYRFVRALPDNRLLLAGLAYVDGLFGLSLKRLHEDGSVDTTFGNEGSVLFSLLDPPESLYCVGVELTGEGKIVVATSIGLVRFLANGTPDSSFGEGRPVPSFQRVDNILYGSALAQDAAGRLIVAGNFKGDFVVARYASNGLLDTSFGNGGFTAIDLGNHTEYVSGVALAPDGKILVGGLTEPPYQPSAQRRTASLVKPQDFQAQAALVRLHADGGLDTSFAAGGKLLLPNAQARRFNAIKVDKQGRALAVASEEGDFVTVRVTAKGELDNEFAPGGIVVTDFGGYESSNTLTLDAAGRAIIGGYSDINGTSDFALARYEEEKITIADVTVPEGHSGTRLARITVKLSGPRPQIVTVNYATIGGSATAGSDYETVNGTLTFAPGETIKNLFVPIIGDLRDERDELFRINLSAPTHIALGDGQAVCLITDDDRSPAVTINDVTLSEGNTYTTHATFTVSLSAPSGQTISINAVPHNGSARAPQDYVGSGVRLVFAPGEISKTFSVPVVGDALDEADETFYVVLSAPVNVSVGRGRGVGLIKDDDRTPSLAINDFSITEGNSGTKNLTFTVTLSAASGQAITLNYATADGIARSNNDYVAQNGTLAFAAGQTSKTLSVLINGDAQAEGNETFFVLLSAPTNATISKARGVGTITNDDASD